MGAKSYPNPKQYAMAYQLLMSKGCLIQQHGTDKKLYEYHDGYSDLSIAKEIGVTEVSIRNLRHRYFGIIRNRSKIVIVDPLESRLSAIEKWLTDNFGSAWGEGK